MTENYKEMKILFIQPCHIGYGGYIRSYALAENLRGIGIIVDHIATGIDNKVLYKNIAANGSGRDFLMPKWNVNHFITGRLYRAAIILFYVAINYRKYKKIHIFNIVQFECWIPAFFLSIFDKKRIVIDWDDYWTDAHVLVPLYDNFLIKGYLAGLEKISRKHFYNFTVASSFLYEKLKCKNKIIIKNVGDQNETIFAVQDNSRNNSPTFLSIGNTLFSERAVYLYRFIVEVRKHHKDAKIITNVSLADICKILIREGIIAKSDRIDHMISSIGYIKHDDLPSLLKECDATIFLTGETNLEMACSPTRVSTYRKIGLPLIMNTTKTDYYRDLKNANCVIDGESIYEIVSKFNEIYSDAEGWKKFKKECNVNWHKYPVWSNEVVKLVEFYE